MPAGIYSGMLEVSGSNDSKCFSEILVNVFKNDTETSSNGSDGLPPTVQIISYICQPPSLYVYADDSSTGGNGIALCEYRIDGGSPSPMNSFDGAWNDNPWETAIANLTDNGTHMIEARCYDSAGNMGTTNDSGIACTYYNETGTLFATITKAGAPGATNLSQMPTVDEEVEVKADCNSTGGGYIVGADIQFDSYNTTYAMTPTNGYFNTSYLTVHYINTPMPAGAHSVTVWCKDSAGNAVKDTKTFDVEVILNYAPITGPAPFLQRVEAESSKGSQDPVFQAIEIVKFVENISAK
jgi:hypothetical protein